MGKPLSNLTTESHTKQSSSSLSEEAATSTTKTTEQTTLSSSNATDASEDKLALMKQKNESEIEVPKSVQSNSDGLVTINGKVSSDEIKEIVVKNSIDDQEKTIKILEDMTFSFEFQLNDVSTSVVIRLCDNRYKDDLSISEWKEVYAQANAEFHQKYIDRLTNDMENLEDSST